MIIYLINHIDNDLIQLYYIIKLDTLVLGLYLAILSKTNNYSLEILYCEHQQNGESFMKNKKLQISEAEWQVMKVIWKNPGLSALEISNEVLKENKWSDGTTRTYLRRLINKGVIRYEQDKNDSRIYYYFPAISEKDALEHESKSFLSKFVKGRPGLFLLPAKNTDLTDEDISELEHIAGKEG